MKRKIIVSTFMLLTIIVNSQKKEMLYGKWKYMKSKDSYLGGIHYSESPNNEKYLIFNSDGTYEEIDNYNHLVGKWKLNQKETKIGTILIQNYNNIIHSSGKYNFMRNLSKVTPSILTFWIQGRHGVVSYKYEKVNEKDK